MGYCRDPFVLTLTLNTIRSVLISFLNIETQKEREKYFPSAPQIMTQRKVITYQGLWEIHPNTDPAQGDWNDTVQV